MAALYFFLAMIGGLVLLALVCVLVGAGVLGAIAWLADGHDRDLG